MIKGNGKFRYFWDLWISLAATYCSIEIPFRLVMRYEPSLFLNAAEMLVTASFIADIFIHFRSTITVNGKLTDNKKTISEKYLKSWFFIDLIAAIPFHLFFHAGILCLLARLPRIIKILRLFQYKEKWEFSIRLNAGLIRLGFFLYLLALFIHWAACGWMQIKVGGELANTGDYILAVYYVITTITTIGYGDITPDKSRLAEVIYVMCIQVAGAASYGYLIGNIATLIANLDMAKVAHRTRVESVNAFMKSKKIPNDLQENAHRYYNYLWATRKGYDDAEILNQLPEPLKLEFSLLLNKDILQKVSFFKNAGPALIREIVLCLKPCIYSPGDIIFSSGEIGNKMYFISKGTVNVISPDGSQVYAVLNDGDFFGELALLLMQPRNATIRATDYCDLYSLDKDSFDNVISRYPDFEKHVKEIAQERMTK